MRLLIPLVLLIVATIHADLLVEHFGSRVHDQLNAFVEDNAEHLKDEAEHRAQELTEMLHLKNGTGMSLEQLESVITGDEAKRSKRHALKDDDEEDEMEEEEDRQLEEIYRELYGEEEDDSMY